MQHLEEKPLAAAMFPRPHLLEPPRGLVDPRVRPILERMLKPWEVRWPWWHRHARILVVVDGISTQPGVEFGVGSVIELVRNSHVGCMGFEVDIAMRGTGTPTVVANPAPFAARYENFKFDMADGNAPAINRYQQIWCFGIHPYDSGTDATTDDAIHAPTTDAELAALSRWMDEQKGGLFATGDHYILGASMCRRIPRVRSMRRWTQAQQVPPVGGRTRIDTLRPPSGAFDPNVTNPPGALGNSPHQGDLMAQPIQWKRYFVNFLRVRPHSILCHPTLGPIDVMPDHAHEGRCFGENEIDLTATYSFDGGAPRPEYPPAAAGGWRPAPEVIATGTTLPSPPYAFVKGPQDAREPFPMISVYDGHSAGVGRVATDSTWHHWMDINIDAMRDANTTEWQKIRRFYLNLAVWLNPPGFSTWCFWKSVVASHFLEVGYQEYGPNVPTRELGSALHHHLRWIYGQCWVWDRIWEIIDDRFIRVRKLPLQIKQQIDLDAVADLMLGYMVEATRDAAEKVKQGLLEPKPDVPELPPPEKLFDKAIAQAWAEYEEELMGQLKPQCELLQTLAAATRQQAS